MILKPSPFAPEFFPQLDPVAGFDMAVAKTGMKYKNRHDLWVLRGQSGTQIGGVFTKSLMPGAPIIWSRRVLMESQGSLAPRLIIVNSGNANVFTGKQGMDAVQMTADRAAQLFEVPANSVMIASTGVIGQPLDVQKIMNGLVDMKDDMHPDLWEHSARAIMTTDTYAKGSSEQTFIGQTPVRINGIAKGSGMIAPDMATMLAFIMTDANIAQNVLQNLLSGFTELTFNAITVDSDMSTSDMLLLAASCAADHPYISEVDDPVLDDFKTALLKVMLDLSHQIIKDGEGASKFITVNVTGAVSDISARKIAMNIANSPLVKTAIAGEDANWGRIVMAVGKSGEPAKPEHLSVWVGPYLLAKNGQLSSDYKEAHGARYMKNDHLDITVDIGLGRGCFKAWTCDLTHQYIDINADYRS